jgi:F0F1-type ATP synthase gamma subunit
VKDRIVGTANIYKITKSMKMVSAAKLRGDQQRLMAARPFGVSQSCSITLCCIILLGDEYFLNLSKM